jgi:cytochrome b6-f complex iron-sulfur subunit
MAAMTTENPGEAPKSKKDMSPEERVIALKQAQEKAARMKAERDAAKAAAAAAEGGGTAVAVAPADAKPAGPQWRIPAAGAAGETGISLARPDIRQVEEVSRDEASVKAYVQRRQVLRGGVFAALGGLIILMVGSLLNLMDPRHITGFGGIVKVPGSQVPKPGADPFYVFNAKAYVVNLKPGEGGGDGIPPSEKGGVVILYQKCPHLGCTVPWRADFDFNGSKGWFRCPCHGSTYTKGGGRVFGPAPHSMDTMLVTAGSDGSLSINSGKITTGAIDDPNRTIQLPSA